MKLFFCPECADVVRLKRYERFCECGKSRGSYRPDGIHADLSGRAIPIGIDSRSFAAALHQRPEYGDGEMFEAFVIPRLCSTVHERNVC